LIHSLTHSLTRSLTHSLTHVLLDTLAHSLLTTLIHSLTPNHHVCLTHTFFTPIYLYILLHSLTHSPTDTLTHTLSLTLSNTHTHSLTHSQVREAAEPMTPTPLLSVPSVETPLVTFFPMPHSGAMTHSAMWIQTTAYTGPLCQEYSHCRD
jgi:hypothetical protein